MGRVVASAGVIEVPLGLVPAPAETSAERKTLEQLAVHGADWSRTGGRLAMVHGAISGGLTVPGFAFVHDLWISDIWFNVGPDCSVGCEPPGFLGGSNL
jgi:hypothetical protein